MAPPATRQQDKDSQLKVLNTPENATYTGPMGPEQQQDTDPREFFRVLWRRKWLILLCLVLFTLAV